MKLPPFLLDQWLQQKFSANPPIEFDLGSSTGPTWTLRELLALGAKKIQSVDDIGSYFVVMQDPEGNEFCID